MRSGWWLLVVVLGACKGKDKDAPAPGSASAAPVAIDAAAPIEAPIDAPVDAAPDLPRSSNVTGPYGIDATTKQTVASLAARGFTVKRDVAGDRNPVMTANDIALAPDAVVGVVAHVAAEGGDDRIVFYETDVITESPPADLRAAYEQGGLCVDNVCPGAPIATAERMKIAQCTAYTVEAQWWFACAVPSTPMVIVGLADKVTGAKHGKSIAFAKLVAAKVEIAALAWGPWIPVVGCTTDCD